jgi:type IV pilus biogenesis protein PilP
VQRAADAAVVPDASAVNDALDEAADRIGPDEEAMSQAVTASLKPQLRPGNLRTVVRREAPQSQAQQQPQTQAAAPRVPSSASVARAATARNAVNMRQVNLIGVYGSPSNRRAIVRLSNGRYQKVGVGDSLDGGRVSAIGSSELRYTKRGRPVVLRMP